MNETDIESSTKTTLVVVDKNEEAAKSIQSPNDIIYKVESSSKGDVVRFYSKQDESIADIVFEVESTGDKKTYFHVHRSVLQSFTVLSELFDCQQDVDTVPIPNVDPKVFHCLLLHAYGGVVSGEDFKSCSKDIIEAADQFGYDELKVLAEEKFLESYPITMNNVMVNLSYADAKNCETILSSVMSFLILNGTEAVEKLSFDEIPGHLMKNLLVATNSLVLSTYIQTQEQNERFTKQNLETREMMEEANVRITRNSEIAEEHSIQIARIQANLVETIPLQEQLDELEEQLEEEEQRANRLEKQLEEERQRIRYLEEERQRVWAWYRRAKDEPKEVKTLSRYS